MFWNIRATSVNVFDEVQKALRFSEIGISAQNHLQIDLRIPWSLSVWLDSRAIDNTIQRRLGCWSLRCLWRRVSQHVWERIWGFGQHGYLKSENSTFQCYWVLFQIDNRSLESSKCIIKKKGRWKCACLAYSHWSIWIAMEPREFVDLFFHFHRSKNHCLHLHTKNVCAQFTNENESSIIPIDAWRIETHSVLNMKKNFILNMES